MVALRRASVSVRGASYATCLPRARSLSRLPRGKAGRAQRPASHAGASAFRWMTSARGGKTPGPTATHLPAHEPEPGHKQRPGMCFRNGRYLGEDHEIIVIVVRRASIVIAEHQRVREIAGPRKSDRQEYAAV